MTTEINLLPETEKRQRQIKEKIIFVSSNFSVIIIPIVEIFFLLALTFNATAYLRAKSEEKSYKRVVTGYQELELIEADLRYFQQKSQALRQVNTQRRTYSKLLETIAILIPENVSFYQLQVSTESIRISAQTKSIRGFATLISNLLESKIFKEVTLTESEYLPVEKSYRIALEIPLISQSLFK